MSDANKAVFLSYASQDAAAVQRIAEALRASGVEVWFDQNELVGGDAWDQKIRRQIKECAIFVPVISANTQARPEGYFRLEWLLAVERSRLMSDDHPFLFPVVIDDTTDAAARVPDRFRDVQWTRLSVKDTPESLAARVAKVLGRGIDVGLGADRAPGHRPGLQRRFGDPWMGRVGVIFALLVGLFYAVRPLFKSDARRDTKPIAAPLAQAAPISEARKLAAKAEALLRGPQYAMRDDVTTAEQFCKQALAIDSGDAEVWATYAHVLCNFISGGYDLSPERFTAASEAANRAIRMAPESFEARFALAVYNRSQPQESALAEAERMLRVLAAERPDDKRVWKTLGYALRGPAQTPEQMQFTRFDEALACFDRANALLGGDGQALISRSLLLGSVGRFDEAEAAIDQAIALHPSGQAFVFKARLALMGRGAMAEARENLARVPVATLREDVGAYSASLIWLCAGEPDKSLEVLNALPRDYVTGNFFSGPKSYLAGLAHRAAGREAAAQVEWRAALQVVEKRLAGSPSNPELLAWQSCLLACVGDSTAAQRILATVEQLTKTPTGTVTRVTYRTYLALGRSDEIVAWLTTSIDNPRLRTSSISRAMLRLDPLWTPLRGHPQFQALLAAPKKQSATTAAAPDEKSVAVLAFADQSPAHDSEYFSDGISEELITVLGKIPGLKVPAHTSTSYFKGKSVPVSEIARQLGVAYVIEGSVQRIGDRVKIAAHLTKAADGFQVWADSFMRDAKDVFAVEAEIAGMIAQNLSLQLGAGSGMATAAVNPQAFELYLQGRQTWNRRTNEGYAEANGLFARAIELDRNFARAYVGQADVLDLTAWDDGSIGRWDQRHSEMFKKIHALLDRAIALDPNLAEAYASLGAASCDEWDYPGAVAALRRAVQLNPNYATGWHWLGEMLWDRGEMDEALVDLRRAAELDPFSLAIAAQASGCLRTAGRPTEALVFAERAVGLQPNAPRALAAKALALLDLGRTEAAMPIARDLFKSDAAHAWWQTGAVVARAGLKDETQKLLNGYRRPGDERLAAPILAVTGRWEEFFTMWQTRLMVTNQPWYLWEPGLDAIRQKPEFLRILEQVGLTDAHTRAQAWRKAHPPESGGPKVK